MQFLLSIKTVFPKPGGKVWYDDQREVHRQIFDFLVFIIVRITLWGASTRTATPCHDATGARRTMRQRLASARAVWLQAQRA
jgi:hypothetical protein